MRNFYHAIYASVKKWSQHQYAYLGLITLSFLESFISPISPLVLLIPMVITKPNKAWRLVYIATLAALVGSILGYFIGHYFMLTIEPYLIDHGYEATLKTAMRWFDQWGLLALFVASIIPIPFKLFTIAAGALNAAFVPFIIVVILARMLHFALIPILLKISEKTVMRWFSFKTR